MHCAIYKCARRPDTYLFIEREGCFDRVPQTLMELMGEMELVMTLELAADRKLAQADVREVMRALREQGYFIQLPPNAFQGAAH